MFFFNTFPAARASASVIESQAKNLLSTAAQLKQFHK